MNSVLDQLRNMTTVVADTGDAAEVKTFRPEDCTTNPSLVLAALKSDTTASLIRDEIARGTAQGLDAAGICDTLTVAIGANLAGLVPGRVSTEVDAHLSFDVDDSVARALRIVEDYDKRGVPKDRILIKLAATWEGIRAAERLEKEGINCNLTLLFSMAQAKACADAGVFLISPFVGRITDWYKAAEGVSGYDPESDPGVQSVREIYDHYKAHGIQTIVMGASFRNIGQIKALAGCDRLTISPALLIELSKDTSPLRRQLQSSELSGSVQSRLNEPTFRWELNESAMATEKLAEGIRTFNRDRHALLSMLTARLE